MIRLKALLVSIATLTFVGCSTTKDISGTYRSNFAEMGFFSTTLKLKKDSTFNYSLRGDLISNEATGLYTLNKRMLLLTYNLTPLDTVYANMYRNSGMKGVDTLKNETNYPKLFYLRNDKIFVSFQNGRIVKRGQTYSKRKKYLFFGSHYYKKKFYLKKVE
jgi:hypothetical protein